MTTYKVQIDDLVRDATAQEAAQIEKGYAETEAKTDKQTAKNAQRQILLDRLGITADEAKLLLG